MNEDDAVADLRVRECARYSDGVPSPTLPDARDGLHALEILTQRLHELGEDLGMSSPERQRLAMLAWTCEARAEVEIFPNDDAIRAMATSFCREIGGLARAFWPGSVNALELDVHPRNIREPLLGDRARSWSHAMMLAERALARLERENFHAGFDAYGWADAFAPPSRDPRASNVLEALEREIHTVGGDTRQRAKDPSGQPQPGQLGDWVRTLRWLRARHVDRECWARLAGRLRRWTSTRALRDSDAARELSSSYVPVAPWKAQLRVSGTPCESHANDDDTKRDATGDPLALHAERIVIIGHRRDPFERARLVARAQAPRILEHIAAGIDIDAVRSIIGQGCDIVIGALGFQRHDLDRALVRLCREARVRYVRTHSFEADACIRAIGRATRAKDEAPADLDPV